MFKNIYQKLILILCIAPSSLALYAMDAKYQFEVKTTQAEVKVRAQEPVAGLNEPDVQIQVKLAWDDQVKDISDRRRIAAISSFKGCL